MNHTPLITIGITAYNATDSIDRAILSAKSQQWPRTEIIVIDDASTDDTWNAIQKHDDLVTIRQNENQGVAAARNRIIKEAKGDFIAFFDDDDESLPERIEKQMTTILELEERLGADALIICHTSRLQNYPDGSNRIEPAMGSQHKAPVPHGEAVAARILTGKPGANLFGSAATCSQMARTTTYRNLEGFDETFRRSEDTEFNIRAALKGAFFPGISDALVIQTMTTASEKTLEAELEYTLKYLEKHKLNVEKTSDYNFCRKWIIAKYDFLTGKKLQFVLSLLKLMVTEPIETIERLGWSIPNAGFNVGLKRFHKNAA